MRSVVCNLISWQICIIQSLFLRTAQPARLIKADHTDVHHPFLSTLKNLLPQDTLQLFPFSSSTIIFSPFLSIIHHHLSSHMLVFPYDIPVSFYGGIILLLLWVGTLQQCRTIFGVKMRKGIGSCGPLPEYRRRRMRNIKIQEKIRK